MVKKIITNILIIFFIFNNLVVLSEVNALLSETSLYYSDLNNNGKIDNLEIEFNNTLTGVINFDKLFLYSNTGGLSTSKLNGISGSNIFSGFYLSGNILGINLVEQDNFLTGLIIDNTTLSHLRLKTNAGVGIFDESGNEIKLLYTSSFNDYNNVFYKEIIINNIVDTVSQTGSLDETSSGTLTSSGEIEINSGTTNTGSLSNTGIEILDQTGVVETYPNFFAKIIFQNPTYLSGKELESNEYNCLTSETDCRVNYNLNIDTGSGFVTIPTTKYNCEWDFGVAEFVEEKYKCNPNTITYPEGNFDVKYKITEISNPNNFLEKTIKIINTGYIKPAQEVKTVYQTSTVTNTVTYMYIDTPKIIIQSGLDENNNCKNLSCSLNLNYEVNNSKEACLWFFPGGSFDLGTDKKCNPGYVKYPVGEFSVKLRVYEIGNETNYKESSIFLKNMGKIISEEKIIKEEDLEENKEEKIEENNKNYTLKISKVLPNPSGKDDIEFIEIQNIGTGEINLNGCELDDKRIGSSKPYKIEKDILLGSGELIKFFKFDTNITLNNSSGDEVNLICNSNLIDNLKWDFDTPDDFLVNEDIIKNIKELEKNYKIEKVEIKDLIQTQTGILNPKVNEIINKTFTQKIKKQKSGIKIYGKTFPNVKIIIKLNKIKETSFLFLKAFAAEENDIYETISDENGNYEIILQKLDIGEFEVKTILYDEKNNYFKIDEKPSFEVDNDYLDYMNFSKDIENKKQKNSNTKENLKSQITLQKLAKNISVSGSKIVCINMDNCNINFDGKFSTGDIKKYLWDFQNGQTSTKSNPKSQEFKTGKYIVSLKVNNETNEDISYFVIEVEGKAKKENKNVLVDKNKKEVSKIKKLDILPTVYADNGNINNDLKTHILLISLIFVIFLIFSFILLRRQKIL